MAQAGDWLPVLIVGHVRHLLRPVCEEQGELSEGHVVAQLQGLVGGILAECFYYSSAHAILVEKV